MVRAFVSPTSSFHVHNESIDQKDNDWIACARTLFCLHTSGSENQLSSTTTSGVRGLPLYATAAIEDVNTTLLIDGAFAHDPRTFSVPFNAGSINSTWNQHTEWYNAKHRTEDMLINQQRNLKRKKTYTCKVMVMKIALVQNILYGFPIAPGEQAHRKDLVETTIQLTGNKMAIRKTSWIFWTKK